MLAKARIVTAVSATRVAGHSIEIVRRMRALVRLRSKGRQIQSFHRILHQGGELSSEPFLGEPLEMNHKVLRKTLDAEKLSTLLPGLAVATGWTFLAI